MNWSKILEGVRNHVLPPAKIKELIESTSKERLAICQACPFNSNNARNKEDKTITMQSSCVLCGCFLILKSKSLSSNCGIEKWNENNPDSPKELKWKAVMTEEEDQELTEKIKDSNEQES